MLSSKNLYLVKKIYMGKKVFYPWSRKTEYICKTILAEFLTLDYNSFVGRLESVLPKTDMTH